MSKKLIVLVGNIASGKTTYARTLVKKGFISVYRDGLRYSIGSGNYVFNKKIEPIIADLHLHCLKTFLSSGYNIVVDETNVTKALRARYITAGKKNKYKIECHILPTIPVKEAIKRRMKDNFGGYSVSTWRRIYHMFSDRYEAPVISEGFDRVFCIE